MEFGKVKKILKFQLSGQTERLIITKLQKLEETYIFKQSNMTISPS